MATSETSAVGDATPSSKSNSPMAVVLNTNIEALAAAKNTVEIPLAKAAFESTIVILTFVRVSISAP